MIEKSPHAYGFFSKPFHNGIKEIYGTIQFQFNQNKKKQFCSLINLINFATKMEPLRFFVQQIHIHIAKNLIYLWPIYENHY